MTDSTLITRMLNVLFTRAAGPGYRKVNGRVFGAALVTGLVAAVAAVAATAPSITTQPESQRVAAGERATFSVGTTGTAPLSYRWSRNGRRIRGAHESSYTTPAVTEADNGASFTVTVTNSVGRVTSHAAVLTVIASQTAVTITSQPQSQTVTVGQTATFSVVAGGTAPLSYQWKKNGAAIAGATASSYATPPTVQTDSGARFSVTVTNPVGSLTSSAATLTVNAAAVAPTITAQPQSQTVTMGQTATFGVVAGGTAPLSYQWKKNGTAIAGATASSYTTPATVQTDNGASFTVTVSNGAGSVTSSAAMLTVNPAAVAPAITTQPQSQTVTAGQTATFSVGASGTAPLSYQWKKNGAAIASATASSYATPPTVQTDSGARFSVTVTNPVGSLTSSAATLTVNAAAVAPTITAQPQSQTVTMGQTATFGVVAGGTAPLSYQWKKNGTAIAGATASSYTTPATVQTDNGASFTVTVSNGAGSVTSSAAMLTVNPAAVAPAITTQPQSQTVTAGQTATFSVGASGTAPLSYQWKRNGTAITGATSASYTTPATVQTDNGASFTVTVSNGAGSVTSSAAMLTVNPAAVAPAITTQPQSQTVTAGQTATFSVGASGTAPLSYQWKRNGTAITGATSASYTTPATVQTDNGASFTVTVSNGAGSVTSSAAMLTVNPAAVAPAITTQPQSQTVTAGQTATFSVGASGTAPLSYQWKRNGTAITGATSASYTTPATVQTDNGASFTVTVSNGAGSVTSSAAMLTVNPVSLTQQSISFAKPGTQTVGTPLTLSATASSGLTVSFASTTASICTVSGTTATFIAAGTCTIQATQPGNGTYAAATPVSQSFTVNPAPLTSQTITFANPGTQTVGTPLTLSATASSGLTVSFASTTAGICTVSGTTATFIAAGTCTIQATQAGNGTYAAATPVSQSFTVNSESQAGFYTLPSERNTLWQPGVTYNGGIPTNRTQCGTTVTVSGDHTGATDTRNIQNAINACSAGHYVLLGPGTFYITTPSGSNAGLYIEQSNITLRGSGAGSTVLTQTDTSGTWSVIVAGFQWMHWPAGAGCSGQSNCTDITIGSVAANPGGVLPLTTDTVKEAYTATVATASITQLSAPLVVGELLYMTEQFDPNWTWYNPWQATPAGQCDTASTWNTSNSTGYCGWGEDWADTMLGASEDLVSRPIGQANVITGITTSGATTTITFAAPWHHGFRVSHAADLARIDGANGKFYTGIGIENLTVANGGGGDGGGNVAFWGISNSWVKNVESYNAGGGAIHFDGCFRCELRDSYLHTAGNPNPGGGGYGMEIDSYTSDSLFENNISWSFNKVMVMRSAGGGNVVGYNYFEDGYGAGYGGCQYGSDIGSVDPQGGQPYTSTCSGIPEAGMNATHMAGTQYALFEGNQSFSISADGTWGNSDYITFFRNHATTLRRNVNNGTGTDTGNGTSGSNAPCSTFNCFGPVVQLADTMGRSGITLYAHHWWYSYVGNVLGYPNNYLQNPAIGYAYPATFSAAPQSSTWFFEWNGINNGGASPGQNQSEYWTSTLWELGTGGGNQPDAPSTLPGAGGQTVLNTVLRDGNFDYVTGKIHWMGSNNLCNAPGDAACSATNYGSICTDPNLCAGQYTTAPAVTTLPKSLYVPASMQPPPFFNGSAWPWVDGTNASTPLPGALPARARFDAGTPNIVPASGVGLTSQSITFANPGTQTVGAPLTLSATASSGLAVSFASTTTSVCTVNGAIATFVAAGTCTIQATQPGNVTYAAATPDSQSFIVNPAPLSSQTITFANPGTQTVGTLLILSATASSGLAVGFASTTSGVCTVSGTIATFVAAGTCTIQATQPGNSTYAAAAPVSQSFTVSLAPQTITFANSGTQTAGTSRTLSATASSGLTVSFASTTTSVCTVSGTTATFVAAGTCTIQATQAGNGTYAAAAPVSQSFTVSLAPQTITFANPGTQTVGKPLTLSATASSGLTVSFASTTTSVCTVSGTTATFVAAGTCTIQATQAGNSTYAAATPVSQGFTVNPAPLISQTITFANPGTQTVGKPLTLSATASSSLTVSFASTTTSICTVSGTTATFAASGTCTIQATQAGNGTYAAATPVPESFTVNPAPSKPTIASFTASPASIASGASSTLSWATAGATGISITPGTFTSTSASGSTSVSPTATTTYTLTATNSAGSTTATATVTVATSGGPLTIATKSCPGGTQGSAYAGCTLVASGGTPPYTYSVYVDSSVPTLPEGMAINATTGVISSSLIGGQGTYTPQLRVKDSAGTTANQNISFAINGNNAFLATVFPSNSIFHHRVDAATTGLPVDTSPAAPMYSAYLPESIRVFFGNNTGAPFPNGIPAIQVPYTQPDVAVSTTVYGSMFTSGPIPAYAPIEGTANSGGDMHVLVYQQAGGGNNAGLYEMWQGIYQGGPWTDSSNAYWANPASNALTPQGQGTSDAAGLPVGPLLVNADEVIGTGTPTAPNGAVQHPIRFTLNHMLNYWVWPATQTAGVGSCTTGGSSIPVESMISQATPPTSCTMSGAAGEIYRLKASVATPACASSSPQASVIITGFRNYGIILADNGMSGGLIGTPDARWNDNDLACLTSITLSNFEPVNVSSLMVNNDSGATSK